MPLIIAIPFLLIPRLYLGQDFEPWTRVSEDKIIENFFEFYISVIPTIYLKLSWLWFLPMLFLVSLLSYTNIIWT